MTFVLHEASVEPRGHGARSRFEK